MAAITTAELVFKYSVKTGAAGNATAGTAAGSLGKYVSTTAWAGGVNNDLFDDITGAENAAATDDYRCIFLDNTNGANALQNAVVFLSAEVAGGASIALAADPTAASVRASASVQALEGTTETAPGAGVTGLTYTSPTTAAAGVALGNIPAGQVKAFWIRRRITANTPALTNDGVTIAVSGDTGSL